MATSLAGSERGGDARPSGSVLARHLDPREAKACGRVRAWPCAAPERVLPAPNVNSIYLERPDTISPRAILPVRAQGFDRGQVRGVIARRIGHSAVGALQTLGLSQPGTVQMRQFSQGRCARPLRRRQLTIPASEPRLAARRHAGRLRYRLNYRQAHQRDGKWLIKL